METLEKQPKTKQKRVDDERGICLEYGITLKEQHLGIIRNATNGRKMDTIEATLVEAIGNRISWLK